MTGTTLYAPQRRLFSFSGLVLAAIAVIFFFQMKGSRKWTHYEVIGRDINWYYQYLSAGVIQGDLELKFLDDYEGPHQSKFWWHTAPNGKKVSKVTCGMAMTYLPAFTAATVYSKMKGRDPESGYSPTYARTMHFSGLLYFIAGLVFLRLLLRRYFSEILTALMLVIVSFGTNLMYYVQDEGLMPHVVNFALINAFVYLSVRIHEKPNYKNALFFGAVLGLIVLIRPTDGIIAMVPLFFGITKAKDVWWKLAFIRENLLLLALSVFAAFLVYLPQLIYWKMITGGWLYYSYGNETFFFTKPALLQTLISYRKGWLLYTPVMALGLAGLVLLRKYARDISWGIWIYVALNLFIISSWWCWWYGGGFGLRAYIGSYGMLMIAMAALFQWCYERFKPSIVILLLLAAGAIRLNQFQTEQYRLNRLHWDGMTKEAYWSIFGTMTYPGGAENYERMLAPPDYEAAKQGDRSW